LPPTLAEDLDRNLCVCNDVPTKDIIKAIENGARTVAEIRQQTYAGMGIGCCTQQLENLIESLSGQQTQE